jgi:putative ABC transport system permease protein
VASLSWRTAWAIARRDLNARFKGLRLLLVCLFLGTGALAAIGSLTGAIERELADRGREILGGDLEVEVWQRAASPTPSVSLTPRASITGEIGGRLATPAGWHRDGGRTRRQA